MILFNFLYSLSLRHSPLFPNAPPMALTCVQQSLQRQQFGLAQVVAAVVNFGGDLRVLGGEPVDQALA
jgi:hypothetical protein